MTAEHSQAMMLLIDSMDKRLRALEDKLDAFYNNGISQLKTEIEIINYSINGVSQSLKAHLDWHNQSNKTTRGLVTIITFLAGVLAGRLGPAVEAFIAKLFSLL